MAQGFFCILMGLVNFSKGNMGKRWYHPSELISLISYEDLTTNERTVGNIGLVEINVNHSFRELIIKMFILPLMMVFFFFKCDINEWKNWGYFSIPIAIGT